MQDRSRNAAVLPLPVIAQAMTSRPSTAGGMASSWIGVGRAIAHVPDPAHQVGMESETSERHTEISFRGSARRAAIRCQRIRLVLWKNGGIAGEAYVRDPGRSRRQRRRPLGDGEDSHGEAEKARRGVLARGG
jgi:hypothetical protein